MKLKRSSLPEKEQFPTKIVCITKLLSLSPHSSSTSSYNIDMDSHNNQSREEHIPQGNNPISRHDWGNYRSGAGDAHAHDASLRDLYGQYSHSHYRRQPNQDYFYHPPYVRYHGQDTIISEHRSASLEDIPSPPFRQHNHAYDPYFARNSPGLDPYARPAHRMPDSNVRYGTGSWPVRHDRMAPHKIAAKHPASSASTLVTPIRPEKQEAASPRDKKKRKSNVPSVRQSNVSSPSIIWDLKEYDVLCGRGAPTNYHSGNSFLRKLVNEYQTVYLCSKRSDKPGIAWKLLDIVTSHGGRFVRRNKAHKGNSNFGWEQLTDKQAYEKICQALREGAPDLRRRMLRDMRGSQNSRGMEFIQEDVNEDQVAKQEGRKGAHDSKKEPFPTERQIDDEKESSSVYPI